LLHLEHIIANAVKQSTVSLGTGASLSLYTVIITSFCTSSRNAPLPPSHSSQQLSHQVQRQPLLIGSRSAEKAVAEVESLLPGAASDVKDLEYALSAAAWNALMLLHSTMIEVSSSHSGSSSDGSIQSTSSSSNSNSDDGTSHNDTSDDSNTGNKIGECFDAAFGVTAAIADRTSNAAEAVAFAEAQPEYGPSDFISAAWKSMVNLIHYFSPTQ
jgi:hypothetical protein